MFPSTASLPASQAKVPLSRRGNAPNAINNTNTANTMGITTNSSNTVTSTATASTVTTASTGGMAGSNNNNSKHNTTTVPTTSTGISTTSRRYRSSGCWTQHDNHHHPPSDASTNQNNPKNHNTTNTTRTDTSDPKMMITATTSMSSISATTTDIRGNHHTNNNNNNNSMMSSNSNSNSRNYHHHPNHRHSRHFHHRHHIQDIMERDDDSDGDDDVDHYDDEEEEEEEEEHNIRVCLHCKSEKTNKSDIQVRCDECTSYICDDCHWCHEYQANHEIRVCDRCDGFYCRHCDEMDQCDDCHEVVCTSCSTLLSCKFCGGGLCEDCATACGRCGIVLCSRDSKFAVECDTCRLSYCLVCLASGSKDSCVRCGSRPSKRMEQLVHLRLKSIYKAFKQNSSSSSYHMNGKYNSSNSPRGSGNGGGGSRHHPQRLNDDLDFGGADDPDVLFQAVKISEAAASAIYANTHKNSSSNNNHNEKPSSSNRSNSNASLSVVDRATRFKEEKEKADAAAAALLAELDEEEEENVKSKNKKKKKKKPKQQQFFPNNETNDMQNNNNNEENNATTNGSYVDDDDDDGSSIGYISNLVHGKGEYVDSKRAAKDNHNRRGTGNNLEQDEDDVTEGADQLEKDLCNLVAAEDVDGLEQLMDSIKGIPGRAALRKNAKKALKKLRLANAPTQVTDASTSFSNIPANSLSLQQPTRATVRVLTPDIPSAPSDPNGYLQVISHVHNKPASQCATPGSQHVNSAQSRSRSNSIANANGPLKSECMMHVRPLIVGWMIGKGGQRIRDLMEESGARIWIDQDSMGPNDPRILYVSGARKNVDIAIGLLQNLVIKYQPLPSPHTRQPTTPHSEKVITAVTGSGKGPSMPETSDIPALPLKQKIGPTTSTVIATARPPSEGRSKQTLSCDPRFVPLLIGRRGWTIKNIQDSTGAKVDIDQTSTPRRITISGMEENVDKAVRMVQDVLSYPHSQLHAVIGNVEHGDENDCSLPDGEVPVVHEIADIVPVTSTLQNEANIPTQSIEVASDIPTPLPVSATANKIPGNSPPSSLIMTGDAKSTISASSSLSSTPEPVLLSGSHAQLPSIDLGPTSTFPLQQGRDIFSSSGGIQQGTFNHAAPQSPLHHPSMFQTQIGNSFFGSHDPKYPNMQSDHEQHAVNAPISLHAQVNGPSFLPDQSSAFYSVHGQTPMPAHPLVPPPTQNLFGIGHLQNHSSVSEATRQNDLAMSAVGSGFWNGIGPSQPNPQHVGVTAISDDGFKLHAAAVDFLEHSQQVHTKPISSVGDINDVLGLSMPPSVGLEQSLNNSQDPLHHFPKGRDDAQMIDSLFGPTLAAVPSSSTADNLLSSLNGLSLRVDEGSSGLWGSSDLLVNSSALRDREDSTLFGGLAPQKSESRFVWEETGQF